MKRNNGNSCDSLGNDDVQIEKEKRKERRKEEKKKEKKRKGKRFVYIRRQRKFLRDWVVLMKCKCKSYVSYVTNNRFVKKYGCHRKL